jgi:rhodanese-related sulfurtransferase
MVQVISRQELQARLAAAKPPIVLEALPEKYYRQGHLPGALHMPHDQVDGLAPAILPDRSAQIVVYCANAQCRNSHIAAHSLSVLGYTNVSVYAGGKKDWDEAGLPLESLAQAA